MKNKISNFDTFRLVISFGAIFVIAGVSLFYNLTLKELAFCLAIQWGFIIYFSKTAKQVLKELKNGR